MCIVQPNSVSVSVSVSAPKLAVNSVPVCFTGSVGCAATSFGFGRISRVHGSPLNSRNLPYALGVGK